MINCTSTSSYFCWPQWEPEWVVKTGCALTEVASDSWNDCHLCVVQVECKPGRDLWLWRSFPSPKLPSCFIRTESGLVSTWEIFVDHVPDEPVSSALIPGRNSRVRLSGEVLSAPGLIFFHHFLRACEKSWVSYHSLVQIQVSAFPHV